MSIPNPSLGWQKLSDVYYSIRTCFEEPNWELEDIYTNYRFTLTQNSTLVAMASRFVPHPNVINVYSLSGTKLWSLVYNSQANTHDHIVDFSFHQEDLCVVLANGKVRVYTDFQGTFDEYSYVDETTQLTPAHASSLPQSKDGKDNVKHVITNLEDNSTEEPRHVLEAEVWGSYLMLRFHDHLSFMDMATFAVYEVPFPGLTPKGVHSMCLISVNTSRLSCIMSYEDTVFTIKCDFASQTYEFNDEHLTDGPFTLVSASSNGQLMSLLNAKKHRIFVTTTRFDKMLLEYDTSNELSVPYMMQWAGNDAIILSLRDEIKLIGPAQKLISFFYDIIEHEDLDFGRLVRGESNSLLAFTIPVIATEVDGLRIITRNKVEFLCRVPVASVNLHLVGSSHPACILLDCVDKLTLQASKADSNISLLNSEGLLVDAIEGCLDAALEEFSPDLQKSILKAASFGKIYVESGFDADKYLLVVNTLKVLNQLRSPEIALFLTYSQLIDASWPRVILMLLKRSLYLLALTIVDLLDLHDCKPSIYIHWCCSKIRAERNMSDIDLFRVISKRLVSAHGNPVSEPLARNCISTKDIFDVALQEGRIDLCKLLVNLEPSPTLMVNQLLLIDEIDLALIKCFQTCNYDLCVLMLRQLKDTLSVAEFQRILNQNELVEVLSNGSVKELLEEDEIKQFFQEILFISGDLISNVWKESTAKHDPKLLEEFYKNSGKTAELNVLRLRQYMDRKTIADDASKYTEIYQNKKKELSALLSDKHLKQMVQAELDCLELRYRLSNTFQQSFFAEKSVVDIVKKLIKMHQLKPAGKVVKEFKISLLKFWYLVLETYCKSKDFDRLHKFILNQNANNANWKAPIAFEEIVQTCFLYECPKSYLSTYIDHCSASTYPEKVRLYLKNEDFTRAAEQAFHNKDEKLLREMQKNLPPDNGDALDAIKSYLTRLGA